MFANSSPMTVLALFQSTQLNLFERFLTQAVSGIDSTGITSGMQKVAYVVLLVGFPVAGPSICIAWRGRARTRNKPH